MAKKKRTKSAFAAKLEAAAKRKKELEMTDDERNALALSKLEAVFYEIGNKKNRYLFYCPDIPFALTTVKVIYQFVAQLNKLGYNARILHEIKGYSPTWMDEELATSVEVSYLSKKKKDGRQTTPKFPFVPSDTIIIPDGFWTVMKGFRKMKPLHKCILALGFGGIATVGDQDAADWSELGFTDIICTSERLVERYKSLWPFFNYHCVPFAIDQEEFSPVPVTEQYPAIGISVRNREDAKAIINIFYNRYPFLDMFQFKVLKRLDTSLYADTIKHCACVLWVDPNAGNPAVPLEAIAAEVPVIGVYGPGVEHLERQENIKWVDTMDYFFLAEELANFCYAWLHHPTRQIKDKDVLNTYTLENSNSCLLKTVKDLQEAKLKVFTGIKKQVEEGKLNVKNFGENMKTMDELKAEELTKNKEKTVDTKSNLKAI